MRADHLGPEEACCSSRVVPPSFAFVVRRSWRDVASETSMASISGVGVSRSQLVVTAKRAGGGRSPVRGPPLPFHAAALGTFGLLGRRARVRSTIVRVTACMDALTYSPRRFPRVYDTPCEGTRVYRIDVAGRSSVHPSLILSHSSSTSPLLFARDSRSSSQCSPITLDPRLRTFCHRRLYRPSFAPAHLFIDDDPRPSRYPNPPSTRGIHTLPS